MNTQSIATIRHFGTVALLTVFVSLLAMTGESAAFDQDKYNKCVKQKCEPLGDAAGNAGAGSEAGSQLGVAILMCTAGCRSKAKQNPLLPCGAEGNRACKVWERIPSCDKGLVERGRRCERR
jgi:hypothetical protein